MTATTVGPTAARTAATNYDAAAQLDRDHPWPGLLAFSEEQQEYFRGRDLETDDLALHVRSRILTVLYGRSGLGKTSLLKAGLFPRLREDDYLPVYVRFDYTPGSAPLTEQIWARLTHECQAERVDAPSRRHAASFWEYLHQAEATFWHPDNREAIPLIVLDQFEEFFTLGAQRLSAGEADAFRRDLRDLVNNRVPDDTRRRLADDPDYADRIAERAADYRILISLREDYYPHLRTLAAELSISVDNDMRLFEMTPQQAISVVEQTGGHLLEPGVAPLIVDAVIGEAAETTDAPTSAGTTESQGVEPALLSLFCSELNELRLRRGANAIDQDLVASHKTKILEDFYLNSFDQLDEGVREPVRTFVEEKLLTSQGHRWPLPVDEALSASGVPRDAMRDAIDRLVSRRLLHYVQLGKIRVVELTHDVLTRVAREKRDARRAEAAREQEAQRVIAERKAVASRRRRRVQQGAMMALLVLVAMFAGAFTFLRRALVKEREARVQAERARVQDSTARDLLSRLVTVRDFYEGHATTLEARVDSLTTVACQLAADGDLARVHTRITRIRDDGRGCPPGGRTGAAPSRTARTAAPAASTIERIEGRWILSNIMAPENAVTTMEIHDQRGDQFRVRGDGWSGTGRLTRGRGYYDWTFRDGRRGRTDIVLLPDGSMAGQVIGSGVETWTFRASRAR